MTSTSVTGRLRSRLLALAGATGLLLGLAVAGVADAHGSTTDPPSRVYGCFDRWGSDFQNPAMATEDPMCWQAWQADPNAMWNWNALSRLDVGGDYQAAIPDGQLCSGGLTRDGRYAAFDEPGPWRAATKPRQFTVTVTDGAQHGAGGIYQAQVDAGDRTGHHIVYTIWLASHKDESYYMCSDVFFQDGTTPPSPGTSPSPTTSPPATDPPGACQVGYTVNTWNTGLVASITITNTGSSVINGWTLAFTLPSGQTITSGWNATYSPTSGAVTAVNPAWNTAINPGASIGIGFQATHAGNLGQPAAFTLNGTTCTLA